MEETPTLIMDPAESTLMRAVAQPVKPCLVLYSGSDAGRRFDLDAGEHILGRAADAQLRIDEPGVSRHHARLQVGGGVALIADLGSANGTLVNEQRVQEPLALRDGDLVRLSNAVLRFHASNNLDLLLHDRIYHQATVDAGTGAFNRRFLLDSLRHAVARARRSGQPLSVVVYDLDHFKAVNDTYGHAAGDTVLRLSTAAVRGALRESDVLARVGGEEFTVLLEQTPQAGALELAERMRRAVQGFDFELPDPADPQGQRRVQHRQTVSLGVAALAPEQGSDAELLQAADRALYAAKRAGRNRVCGAGMPQAAVNGA